MNKYLAIINHRTLTVALVCTVVTYLCYRYNFSYNLDVFVFSISIIFPLVFTIREAFKRRDNALKFLSKFKASMNGVYHSLENNGKLELKEKEKLCAMLNTLSKMFMADIKNDVKDTEAVQKHMSNIYAQVKSNSNSISLGASMKIFRFLTDIHESMENVFGLKRHGTPISLRAYCLVFIYIFPVIFTPSIMYDLSSMQPILVYILSILHGFILISLYNLQEAIENPFDQIGLDDINLEQFQFSVTGVKSSLIE